jgi:hypothetical protein
MCTHTVALETVGGNGFILENWGLRIKLGEEGTVAVGNREQENQDSDMVVDEGWNSRRVDSSIHFSSRVKDRS